MPGVSRAQSHRVSWRSDRKNCSRRAQRHRAAKVITGSFAIDIATPLIPLRGTGVPLIGAHVPSVHPRAVILPGSSSDDGARGINGQGIAEAVLINFPFEIHRSFAVPGVSSAVPGKNPHAAAIGAAIIVKGRSDGHRRAIAAESEGKTRLLSGVFPINVHPHLAPASPGEFPHLHVTGVRPGATNIVARRTYGHPGSRITD